MNSNTLKRAIVEFDGGDRVVITDPDLDRNYIGTICMAAEDKRFRLPDGRIHGASKCDWVIRLDYHVMAPSGEDRQEGLFVSTRYVCAPTSMMSHYDDDQEVA